MYEKLTNTISRRPRLKSEVIEFGPWHDGLVTEYEPEQMRKSQLFESLNMVIVGPGVQRTRDGSTLVSTGCTGAIVQVEEVNIGGTDYTVMSDADNKLYYDNSGTATAIATLGGEVRFCKFMDLLILFDGSYIKAWDGTDVFILYDNGTGSSAYQLNQRTDTATTTEDLDDATTSVSYNFTTQAWNATYTIPPTHFYCNLYKVGTPTGTITAKLTTTDDVVMASKALTVTAADLTTETDGEEYEAIFTSSDVTTEMAPDTEYKLVLEYEDGDAANYVVVKKINAGTPQFSLKPGMPPKSVFGLVFQDRLHCIEGTAGTNPSYRWYCAAGNHLDWSTPDGGGYTPVIDSSATNYPIGGMAAWNNDLWFFGTPAQPYLGKQSGTTPSAWAINATMQNVSGHYKSIVVTPDNIVFLHPSGVDMISAVEASSDIAAESQADNIRSVIQQNFSTAAVAGYDPEWGLYVFKMAGTDYTYVVHTRAKSVRYSGRKQVVFSPATRWEYDYTPSAFGTGDGYMLVGSSAGKVYKMDKSVQQDNTVSVDHKVITSASMTRFGQAQSHRVNFQIYGRVADSCTINFYKDFTRNAFLSKTLTLLGGSSTLTMNLDDILTADADFPVVGQDFYDRVNINFNFRSLMIGIEDMSLYNKPLYIGGITVESRQIGGL